jgi:transposase-like protein
LRSKGSTNDALALIETQFAADPSCGHCHSKHFGTWGHASGLRRYMCKDCGRTFNALTGDGPASQARCLARLRPRAR